MTLFVSRFQIMMQSDAYLVALSCEDDYGLYSRRTRNSFGTSLLARGTFDELTTLAPEARLLG